MIRLHGPGIDQQEKQQKSSRAGSQARVRRQIPYTYLSIYLYILLNIFLMVCPYTLHGPCKPCEIWGLERRGLSLRAEIPQDLAHFTRQHFIMIKYQGIYSSQTLLLHDHINTNGINTGFSSPYEGIALIYQYPCSPSQGGTPYFKKMVDLGQPRDHIFYKKGQNQKKLAQQWGIMETHYTQLTISHTISHNSQPIDFTGFNSQMIGTGLYG